MGDRFSLAIFCQYLHNVIFCISKSKLNILHLFREIELELIPIIAFLVDGEAKLQLLKAVFSLCLITF